MKSLHSSVPRWLILSWLLIAWSDCAGIVNESNWTVGARLRNELSLANGPDIYMSVAKLFDQREALDGIESFYRGASGVCWVWKSNPKADKLAFTLTWPKGTEVADMVRDIARRRSERLHFPHMVVILPDSDPAPPRPPPTSGGSLLPPKGTPQRDNSVYTLKEVIHRPIEDSIILHSPDEVEDFLNYQFQKTYAADLERRGLPEKPGQTPPYRIKFSAAAKEKTGGVNYLGLSTYKTLFDMIGLCCGLQWHVDGNTVIFETTEEQKGRK